MRRPFTHGPKREFALTDAVMAEWLLQARDGACASAWASAIADAAMSANAKFAQFALSRHAAEARPRCARARTHAHAHARTRAQMHTCARTHAGRHA